MSTTRTVPVSVVHVDRRVEVRALPHLVERDADQPPERDRVADHHAHRTVGIRQRPRREGAAGDLAQPDAHLVDAGGGGERVVDARRQRTHRDLGELPDRELNVLHRGAPRTGDQGGRDVRRELVGHARRRPGMRERGGRYDEAAWSDLDPDLQIVLAGEGHQAFEIEDLHVATGQRLDPTRITGIG